jgi:hypothetical protein
MHPLIFRGLGALGSLTESLKHQLRDRIRRLASLSKTAQERRFSPFACETRDRQFGIEQEIRIFKE